MPRLHLIKVLQGETLPTNIDVNVDVDLSVDVDVVALPHWWQCGSCLIPCYVSLPCVGIVLYGAVRGHVVGWL